MFSPQEPANKLALFLTQRYFSTMSKPNIFIFSGSNQQDAKTEINKWQQSFKAKHNEINLEVFDTNITTSQIIQSSHTMPFLGERRLIIVHDFFSTAKKEELEALVSKVAETPDTTILVFFETTPLDKRLKTSKDLLKIATVKDFPILHKNNIPKWIINKAAQFDQTIDYHLATELGHQFSQNPERLDTEITKLCTYNAQTEITKEAIQAINTLPFHDSIFDLTDALTSTNKQNKLTILHNLYHRGEDLIRLLYMLINQIRLLTITHLVNSNFDKVAELKIHPFVQQKLKQQSRNITLPKLQQIYARLQYLDEAIKTGKIKTTKGNQQEILFALERLLFIA
ncbi:DNA polymerase III subunit delta [Candidatus Peregrinibacteria bacterium CG_4_9_14_0_2_um_filter_41_14]|nr:MAG: DNA polymerase III subunit delta [Candidatus Peregrinibacteria bacterium CG_4_10_14_0_2_um_filter_41_8]PJC37851.1 MAG: DNA polymerase III subunit delta [Candidatus Peregrinibacteria bacterium CG_4_9_14_0_2_um_filter_41_14]